MTGRLAALLVLVVGKLLQVIEPHWHSMHTNLLTNVQNIDDVIRMHQEFQVRARCPEEHAGADS